MKKPFENKKVTLGVMTALLILAIIVVSSFWPFILDPKRVMTEAFLSDELIITAITLSVTMSFIFIAQAGNAANPASELARSKVSFADSVGRIKDRAAFFAWVKDVFQESDREKIAKREMERILAPLELYGKDIRELKALRKSGAYDKGLIKGVIRIKKGVARFRFVDPNYYTTVKSMESFKTLSEIASGETAKKVFTIVAAIAVKVLVTWAGASIFMSLVYDVAGGGSAAQACMTFFSRMFAFGSSCFLGYRTGVKVNDIDAYYIDKRVEVHGLYVSSLNGTEGR